MAKQQEGLRWQGGGRGKRVMFGGMHLHTKHLPLHDVEEKASRPPVVPLDGGPSEQPLGKIALCHCGESGHASEWHKNSGGQIALGDYGGR